LAEIAEVLLAQNIGAAVVADVQGNLHGLLSERDIVRAISNRGTAALTDAVSMHMTRVVTTTEDESIHEAMEKMTNERFRHLPVISHERLVGLVSIGDLVKYRLAECEYEHKAMREYIASA
jgi:CBS domain-containing protein